MLASYPHMGPEDTKAWTNFILSHPNEYDSIDYDVKIGNVPAFVTRDIANIGGDIASLYQRKIDVVAYKEDKIDIIEVKPDAGFSAIGQVLGYFHLWQNQYGSVENVNPMIVCNTSSLDVRALAEAQGVKLIVT